MGMNEQVLRNKVNPNAETMAAQLGYVVSPADAVPEASLMVALLHAEREHSDVVREAAEALADGRLTPREKARIRAELSELTAALQSMDATLVGDCSC